VAPFVAGAAAAAAALGYEGFAQVIEFDGLGPHEIFRALKLSAAHARGIVCAIILLSGAIARLKAQSKGWDGEPEKSLAVAALEEQGLSNIHRRMVELTHVASRIVRGDNDTVPTWLIGKPPGPVCSKSQFKPIS
jgi:hypothetical protein